MNFYAPSIRSGRIFRSNSFPRSKRFVRLPETVFLGQYRTKQISLPSTIKLLSWNIAKLTQQDHWRREFANLLEEHQPDLIFLQEAWLCARTRHLHSLAKIPWYFAPNFLDTHHHHYSGVLIATKAECLANRSLLTHHHEPIVKTPKVALLSEFALNDSQYNLLSVNAHLINFVELRQFRAQLVQLEACMGKHEGPIIFAGDFNTWHQSRWDHLNQMTKKLGLQPMPFAVEEKQKIKRFLNSPPLDYIFFRGFQSQPISAKVIETTQSSDHQPLIVELVLEKPSAESNSLL
jgi:endonuclease/exonuclease/phosphatase (EEP) superfamily protein YafD